MRPSLDHRLKLRRPVGVIHLVGSQVVARRQDLLQCIKDLGLGDDDQVLSSACGKKNALVDTGGTPKYGTYPGLGPTLK